MPKQEQKLFVAPRWPLTPYMVAQVPELPGVFTIWQEEEVIYIGRAVRPQTLRSLLEEHLRGSHPCTARATHYAWQLCLDPAKKEREVLGQYHRTHRAFPRCNRQEV